MSGSSGLTCRAFSRFIYTHNPFYLVSALLVLVGLHEGLADNSSLTGGWLLMGVLCGYTLLLVIAGYVIVCYGQVWEDARMILLVVVLLFLALSVSFDRIALDKPISGARFLLIGLAFSMLVSEGVFHSLKIHLATHYRVPYYLVLALLFSYPLGLAQLSVQGRDIAMAWGVFLFPVCAAAVLLTLWPAARRRAADEPPSGTPWSWPWFPWSLFAFLLLAITLRSYSLSMAFEAAKGSAVSFKAYFLSPLVLVSCVLPLEMAIANHSRWLRCLALLLPMSILLLSMPGWPDNAVAMRFLMMLCCNVGSPLQLALVGLTVFYLVAWLRGLRSGELGLIACMALASVAGRQTIDLDSLSPVQPWPLVALAALELPLGLWRRSYLRTVVGSAAGTMAFAASGWLPSQSTPSPYLIGHAGAIMLLVAAAIYDDRWARLFRQLALPLIPIAGLVAAVTYEFAFPVIPRTHHAVFLLALLAVAVLYWRRRTSTPQLLAVLASLGSLLLFGSRSVYVLLATSPLDKGLPWIAGGLTALIVALVLSFLKAGLLARGWMMIRSLNRT